MKAFLVARVSTDDQKDALPAQAFRLIEYAKRRGYGYELTEIRESAYKGNRSAFSELVKKITLHSEISVVVFDKIDRYTRDSSSQEVRILDDLRKSGKIELHFPSDNLFIHRDSPATDLLRLGMGVVVAQYYSDAISDNVRRRFEQKLRDGEWIGMAPLGYKNTVLPNGKKWIEIDPYPAEIIRQIFARYAEGNTSIRIIAEQMRNEYGIKIGQSKVDQTLKNPFYYGEMRVKGLLYPHKYEPLVSFELFERVKSIQEGYKVEPKRWGGLPYVYRGLLRCESCGCRITFEKKKQKYIYGHCTQSRFKHDYKYVSEELITKQVMKIFEAIKIPEDTYQEVSTVLRQTHEDKKRYREQTLSSIESEITKFQSRIDRVYEDYLDDKITEELYQRKSDEYRANQKKLQRQRDNIELVDDEYFGTVFHLLNLAKSAPKLFQKANIEQKRSLLQIVLSNFSLDGDQLRWKLKEPFETMVLCSENSSWLRQLGSNQRPNR